MNLALSLEQRKENSMLIRAAMAIAMECYNELQTSMGFQMRSEKLLDVKRLLELISVFGKTKEGERITLDLKDMLLLVSVFDITTKSLTSNEPYRFIHAFDNDTTKRSALRSDLLDICTEMTTELSEQAMYRHELQQHRRYLTSFVY